MASLLGKFIGMWVRPMDTMASLKAEDNSIKSSMVFIVVMGILSGIITAVMGMIFPPQNVGETIPRGAVWLAVVLIPLLSFIGSFIGAFILQTIVVGMLMGTVSHYALAYRLLALLSAYQPVSSLLSPIPKAGVVVAVVIGLWALIVLIRGIIIVFNTKRIKTWIICGILFGVLYLLGVFARMATDRGFSPLEEPLGGPTLGGDDGQLDMEDDLQRELEALEQREKAAPKKGK